MHSAEKPRPRSKFTAELQSTGASKRRQSIAPAVRPSRIPHLRLRVTDQPYKRQPNDFPHVDLDLDLDVDVGLDVLLGDTSSRAS